MRYIILLFAFILITKPTSAHDIHYNNVVLREWRIPKTANHFVASFCSFKNGEVYLQKINTEILKIKLDELSETDQQFVLSRFNKIKEINSLQFSLNEIKNQTQQSSHSELLFMLIYLILAGITFYVYQRKKQLGYFFLLVSCGIVVMLSAFTHKRGFSLTSSTRPSFLDSSFAPFKPNVNTYLSSNYYFVESLGIPATHTMMVGISNHGWQQQVPLPQCYLGANAWLIPLTPTISNSPIPVDSIHFTRGAIAIAVNGVPIFNVHTNTGVDSYLDGQLDNYGGHCGRADDYHYHIAPLHLYNYTSQQLPIAFALDGFAVYGALEPDGSNMTALDGNHGHFGSNGVYHYHGTATAPYMIAKMVGQVTEDATHQLIPQPAATPVRPSLTPLSGALITSCKPNALNNGYTLKYLLNSVNDSIVYSWNSTGKYTFTYYTAIGVSTNTYNGFTQCVVKLTTDVKTSANSINEPIIYPNPSSDFLHVITDNQSAYGDIHNISIYTLEGKLMLQKTDVLSEIDLHKIAPGTYFVIINLGLQQVTKKLIIQ